MSPLPFSVHAVRGDDEMLPAVANVSARLCHEASGVLRDVAYVLHLTRRIRAQILQEQAESAD